MDMEVWESFEATRTALLQKIPESEWQETFATFSDIARFFGLDNEGYRIA
jgi:hypothetical protein